MNGRPRPSSPSCWKPLRFPRLNSVSIAAARGSTPEQVQQWRQACILGQQSARALQQAEKAQSKADKKRIRQLEQELRRKDKALAEAAALLILQKSSMPTEQRRRGRLTSLPERQQYVAWWREALAKLAPASILRPRCWG